MPDRDGVVLHTRRLILRPSDGDDFARAFEIRSNWNVTRNLSHATFPPDAQRMATWFAGHRDEWAAGTAYRFAVLHDGWMIGIIDIGDIADGVGSLGYWFDEAAWGQGFASEAGQCVIDFAFEQAGMRAIIVGHATDNLASAHVLAKLGFSKTDEVTIFSRSRQTDIRQVRLRLERPT
jgi:RimJ/RimL family protein N-acetyltransferase